MRLCELSICYGDSAVLLRQRMTALREEGKATEDPELRRILTRRIAELRPLLQEMRDLQRLTAHYYDRGVQRNAKYSL